MQYGFVGIMFVNFMCRFCTSQVKDVNVLSFSTFVEESCHNDVFSFLH